MTMRGPVCCWQMTDFKSEWADANLHYSLQGSSFVAARSIFAIKLHGAHLARQPQTTAALIASLAVPAKTWHHAAVTTTLWQASKNFSLLWPKSSLSSQRIGWEEKLKLRSTLDSLIANIYKNFLGRRTKDRRTSFVTSILYPPIFCPLAVWCFWCCEL